MRELYIEKTKSTPEVRFDPQNNKLAINGQSYPENAFKFYEPIFTWLEEYLQDARQGARISPGAGGQVQSGDESHVLSPMPS